MASSRAPEHPPPPARDGPTENIARGGMDGYVADAAARLEGALVRAVERSGEDARALHQRLAVAAAPRSAAD
jgi:hypothetical protein